MRRLTSIRVRSSLPSLALLCCESLVEDVGVVNLEDE